MRVEFAARVKLKAYVRSLKGDTMKEVECFECKKLFQRYRMNATRAAKPQFCSEQCNNAYLAKRADERRHDRFWSKVSYLKDNGGLARFKDCWEWTAQKDSNGYGKFQFADGKPMLAHRFAYETRYGAFNKDLFVCHKCDNPSCVRPSHLFLGTAADNMADCAAKGRTYKLPRRYGSDVNTSKLTQKQASIIYNSDDDIKELAERFGVTTTAIRAIKTGKNWKWVNHAA